MLKETLAQGPKGIKRIQRYVSSLALFSFSFGLVFMCTGVLGNYSCISCIQMLGSLSQLIQKALRTSGSGGGKGIEYFSLCVTDVDL